MSNNSDSFKDTVEVLFAACGDKDDSVNSTVTKSLIRLASVYPNEVIEYFCEYYERSNKLTTVQLANIIKVLEQTCVNHIKSVRPELPELLVAAMLDAMIQSNDYEPTVQLGASSVLVAVGHVHLDLVLQTLIQQFTASSVPHYAVPHTLGTLAAVNTLNVVPFIKDILAKMLPLLSIVKSDGLKQAFAYAFGHFAVAVSEQIGENVQSDNITSIKENFVVEFTVIFDVLYSQWLLSYEAKVSESVLEALGPITRLISERKFDETVNKFVQSLLALYRKPSINPYYISQCISYLFTPSPLNPKLALNDNVLSAANHVLFNMVLVEPDYDQPHTVKNHFEVLRCFDHLAVQFPEQIIDSVLHQCKNNNEKERMKAVIILTHLTTSSQFFIDKYAAKFIAILKVMVAMEQGLKMKKLLVKAIVGLVYRNCVDLSEDFQMVELIIKNSGYEPQAVPKADVVDLYDTCRSSLILMCNSATNIRSQLRDLLLKSLTVEEFTPSMSTVAYCLTSLLQNNSESAEETSEKSSETKVSPDLVFVRCLTHLAEPDQVERNKNILVFLDEYSGDIHKNLKNSWAVEVERLLQFVKKNEPSDEWHDMLLNLLVAAIEQINSNKWVEIVSSLLSQQILSTKQPPMIKGISLQYLSILTCHMSNAAVVEQTLKIILLALKSIPMHSVEYVSKAVGIAARHHGEYVLNELDAVYKDIESRRSNKLMSLITARTGRNEEINVMKYAAIVCYGRVASECIDVHVLGRLGDHVTAIIFEILKSNPSIDLCRAAVTTLYEITRALQPAAHHNIVLRNRWQLLNAVLEQIYNNNLERRNVELYPIIVKASMGLTKLQKGILPEERNTILRVLFNSIFGELSSFKKKYEVEGNGETNDRLAKTLNDSLMLLHELIRELIIQSTCLSTVDDLVSLLLEWLRHENDEIRTASFMIFQVILDTYIKNVKLNYETPSKFGQMGYLLGLIVPGVADTNFPVRLTTVDCIKLIIQIQYLYEGHTIDPDDECLASLTALNNNILTNDLGMISAYCATLSDCISEKIPHQHTMQFIESLLEGYDEQELRSTGVSCVIEALFIKKGQELYQCVEGVMESVLGAMGRAGEGAGRRLLPAVTSLARHHCNAVTAVLLAQKIPLKPCVTLCWRHLSHDKALATAIVENFIRLMTSIELFEDPYHVTDHHIAALQPLTLISALGEMLHHPTMKDICVVKFADLFSILFTTLACYIDAEPPAYSVPANKSQERFGYIPNREAIKLSPARITMETFNAFLEQAECHKVREACTLWLSVEHGDSAAALLELVPALGGPLCRSAPQYLPRVVASVATYARSPLPPHRVAALALLADLLKYRCNDNEVLIETALASVQLGARDRAARVRGVALRGLAAAAALRTPSATSVTSAQQPPPAVMEALTALSQGIDAPNTQNLLDNVPLASMQGLGRLLSDIDSMDKEYERELLSISQKIRPFMNTDCVQLREQSIRLFGIISSKVKSENLSEQAVSALPCFLLHLCDNNPVVVRASKFTLKQVFVTLEAPKCNELVQLHLGDDSRLVVEDFLASLLRSFAKERPEYVARCLQAAVNYLHCAREDLKPYPPFLIGKLYMELYTIRESRPELCTLEEEVCAGAGARLAALVRGGEEAARTRAHAAAALAALALLRA